MVGFEIRVSCAFGDRSEEAHIANPNAVIVPLKLDIALLVTVVVAVKAKEIALRIKLISEVFATVEESIESPDEFHHTDVRHRTAIQEIKSQSIAFDFIFRRQIREWDVPCGKGFIIVIFRHNRDLALIFRKVLNERTASEGCEQDSYS